MQMCWGASATNGLQLAYELWRGGGKKQDWDQFNGSHITIFEDAVKGLKAGVSSQSLMERIGIDVDLRLVGISSNPIKRAELKKIADVVHSDINQFDWGEV
jgi:hypothetical protein